MDTKNLKEVTSFILALTEAIVESLEDGKITISDSFNFADVVSKIGPAIDDIASIPAEIADLTQDEIEDIIFDLKEEFDLDNDILEANIELAIEAGLKIAQLVGKFV